MKASRLDRYNGRTHTGEAAPPIERLTSRGNLDYGTNSSSRKANSASSQLDGCGESEVSDVRA